MADITNMLADAQQGGLLNNEYWQKRLLRMIAIEADQFVFQHLGMPTKLPANMGTKRTSYRRYLRLPVDIEKQKLAEGVAPDALKIEGTKVTGVVDQYGAWLRITDVVDAIHMDDIRNIYQPELARHAAELRERITIAAFSEASEVFVGGGSSVDTITGSDTLTLSELRNVRLTTHTNLRRPHRKYGRYAVIVSPQVMQDLVDDEDLLVALQAGQENAPLKKGTVADYTIYDLAFVETQMLADPTVNTAELGVYKTVFLGDAAYATIELSGRGLTWHNKPFNADTSDPLAQLASVGYKMWYGAKVIDPLAITVINSAAKRDIYADFTDPTNDGRPANQDPLEPEEPVDPEVPEGE